MRARVVAPVLAALLGIAGGTATAYVTSEPERPSTPAEVRDPLGLGIPLVRLECSPHQGVLVLGFGDTAPALLSAIADNPDGEPSYVDTVSPSTYFRKKTRVVGPGLNSV